jgi:myo-inositol 2-dehydrogenase/D-chiro-inositol 1-dehydrogenase
LVKRFCLIGAGRIGQIHARNLVAHEGAQLVGVADVNAAAAGTLARSVGSRVVDVKSALQDPNVDAVLIASSTDTHAELIAAAAGAGKAILCEKPLDLDTQRAAATLEVVHRAGVLLALGFNRRFDPSFNRLHARAVAGDAGKVETVTITSRDPAPPPVEYVACSGGLFRDMMIHDFDMARWLLREEPVTVTAMGACLVDPAIGKAGDIDTAVVVLQTASGSLCQITNSRRCAFGYDQRIEVFGSAGMVRADNRYATSVERAGARGFEREPVLNFFLERYAEAYRLELASFIDVLEGRPGMVVSGLDGLRALQLADAAQDSFERGTPVATGLERS